MPIPPEPEAPKYATYIASRRPPWKFHTGIGHAKAALAINMYNFQYARMGQIYEKVGGEWTLLYDIPKRTLKKDLPWSKENKEG